MKHAIYIILVIFLFIIFAFVADEITKENENVPKVEIIGTPYRVHYIKYYEIKLEGHRYIIKIWQDSSNITTAKHDFSNCNCNEFKYK